MRHTLFLFLIFAGTTAFTQTETVSDQKVTTALINLKAGNGVNEGESEIISDRLRSELFKTGKVTIMERDQMQEILKEQGFQQSGACTDEACLVEMGQMLGVKHLVVGSLGKLGSMFMVNVRAIDVQTSKVINVVSVDVKGEIEDLVNKLPYIASQLVSEAKTDVAVKEQTPPPEVSPEPQEELKPEVPETTTVATVDTIKESEEKKPEAVKEIGKNKDKNENRFGVSFVMEIGGPARHYLDDSLVNGVLEVDTNGQKKYYYGEKIYNIEKTPLVNLQVRFQIKAGPFLNIAIGPGYMFETETFTVKDSFKNYSDEVNRFDINYAVPMIHLGLSFAKRIYPIKINAGGFINFAMPITTYSYTISGTSETGYTDETNEDTDVDFKINPGFRAGVEFLIGAHFGIGAEGVWSFWSPYETKFNYDETGLNYHYTDPIYTQEIKFPPLKLGLNFNVYF
jgi:hypothetical protein